MTSLVERVSRFAVFLHNNDRQSRPVMGGLIQVLQFLHHLARLVGGDTVWSNTAAAYLDLPAPQQRLANALWAVHSFPAVLRAARDILLRRSSETGRPES